MPYAWKTCPGCNGRRTVTVQDPKTGKPIKLPCPTCDGLGQVYRKV
jgi:DnaJ-class molecular chaperone